MARAAMKATADSRRGALRRRAAAAWMALAALIVVAGPVGCAGDSDMERGTQRFLTDIGHGVMGHRSSREELRLPVEGLVNVEVRNFAGDVVIRGDRPDRTQDALVILDRRGEHRGFRDKESEASLPLITWDVRITPPAGPGEPSTLVVEASTTHDEPWYQRLDIEVTIAELGRITVETTRGRVQVSNNRGPVDITTTKGNVRVVTPWPQKLESIIVTRDGDIDYRVRGESSFVLDAETIGGTVKARCTAGRWTAHDARNDHDSMHATLNDGGERLILRTVDGNIRVGVVEEPGAIGSFIVTP